MNAWAHWAVLDNRSQIRTQIRNEKKDDYLKVRMNGI